MYIFLYIHIYTNVCFYTNIRIDIHLYTYISTKSNILRMIISLGSTDDYIGDKLRKYIKIYRHSYIFKHLSISIYIYMYIYIYLSIYLYIYICIYKYRYLIFELHISMILYEEGEDIPVTHTRGVHHSCAAVIILMMMFR
jgi:hypothetical protein